MADQLDSPMPPPTAGRRGRYPWVDWMDGSVWKARRGEDFEISSRNFVHILHMRARRFGIAVQTHRIEDDTAVLFQFQGVAE